MQKLEGKKDQATVTAQGASRQKMIEGVQVRRAITQFDDRGTLTEVFDPAWGLDNFPMVYLYHVTIRPHKIKGWVVHHLQTDRLYIVSGHMRVVLYDDRPESPTYRMINEIYMTEQNRSLLHIPPYVYHALQNLGETDANFINTPSRPYNHDNPDKFRLPLSTDQIPYSFIDREMGW